MLARIHYAAVLLKLLFQVDQTGHTICLHLTDFSGSWQSNNYAPTSRHVRPCSVFTTEFIVGLSVTGPAGSSWKLKPQFGDLKRAEAGFMTGLGKFQANWEKSSSGYTLKFQTPLNTMGVLSLPLQGPEADTVILVNGTPLRSNQGKMHGLFMVLELSGGNYDVIVTKK